MDVRQRLTSVAAPGGAFWRRRVPCVRRNRLGPTPRCRCQLVTRLKPRTGMVSQKAESPGRSRISRKAIAQGRPDASAKPVCLRAPSCCNYRTQDRGCGARPVFPAPSFLRGSKRNAKLRAHRAARTRSRNCNFVARMSAAISGSTLTPARISLRSSGLQARASSCAGKPLTPLPRHD